MPLSTTKLTRFVKPGWYQLSEEGEVARSVFPSAEVIDVNGATVDSAEFIGAPMVVNLWFAACPPCQREMPDFAAVHERVGDEVGFVGINPIDSASAMTDFADRMGVKYELYRDPLAELWRVGNTRVSIHRVCRC